MRQVSDKADVVIIGGGVVGLGLAYRLVERGVKDVVVLEKSYIGSGASGRNPGGIRQQLSLREDIALARESVKIYKHLSGELNFNIFFRQGGYLILAFTEQEVEQFKKNVKLQNSLGVRSKIIRPNEAKEIVPMLATNKLLGATYCPTDGILYPYAVLWGYARAAKRMGAKILTFTDAKRIKVEGGEVKAVATDKGEIKTPVVVNAAGAHAAEVASMAGVELPNKPFRHEAAVTEPLKPFLDPMVLSFHHTLYVGQMLRGEVFAGVGNLDKSPSHDLRASADFLPKLARAILEIMPQFGELAVMRQWVGIRDMTPDGKPILGEMEGVRGLIQANGFGGLGMMLSASAVKLLAELILTGKTPKMLEPFSLARFREEKLEKEMYITGMH